MSSYFHPQRRVSHHLSPPNVSVQDGRSQAECANQRSLLSVSQVGKRLLRLLNVESIKRSNYSLPMLVMLSWHAFPVYFLFSPFFVFFFLAVLPCPTQQQIKLLGEMVEGEGETNQMEVCSTYSEGFFVVYLVAE